MKSLKMIEVDRINDEVFVAKAPIVCFGREELVFVKNVARSSPRRRARICAHKSAGDALHEMLIALFSEGYVRPHKHRQKSESFHVVEGEADVVVFTETGEISAVVRMGEVSSAKRFYYRLPEGYYHTVLVRSEWFVLHEVTNGPFHPEDTFQATFAPAETEREAVRDYVQTLSAKVEKFLS